MLLLLWIVFFNRIVFMEAKDLKSIVRNAADTGLIQFCVHIQGKATIFYHLGYKSTKCPSCRLTQFKRCFFDIVNASSVHLQSLCHRFDVGTVICVIVWLW